mmetsp:Transcript_53250/g.121372  ORF Transcript_53250/g.121372 Transcript_53250/m.121372 type:complete len:95 (+) Transcript_53250:171-455(+)
MIVLQITVQRYMRDTEEPVMLSEVSDLKPFGFFQRPTCQQLLNAFTKIVVKRISPGQRITVEVDGLNEYQVHTYGGVSSARAVPLSNKTVRQKH